VTTIQRENVRAARAERPWTLRLVAKFVNPVLRMVLATPLHRLLSRKMLLLKYQGRFTGRRYVLPLTYAQDGETRLILVAGHPDVKTWWRNFDEAPRPVVVKVRGKKMHGTAHVLELGHVERLDSMCVYIEEFPKAKVGEHDPVIVITLNSRLPIPK
jgi:hypothetical protein